MSGSIGALALRMIISLGVVLGLMWLAARVLSGRNGTRGIIKPGNRRAGRNRPAAAVQVLGRTSLGKSLSVTVVQACGRTIVLGVTPHAINVLASDDAPLDSAGVLAAVDQTTLMAPNSPVLDVGRSLVPTAGRTPTAPGWKPVLDALRERTVRRP